VSWRVEFRPEVEEDIAEAVAWYEARQPGLGAEFIEDDSNGSSRFHNPVNGSAKRAAATEKYFG
jgi:hypothetical protein